MNLKSFITIIILLAGAIGAPADHHFASDTIATTSGEMVITFIGHGTLMLRCNETVIHVDPVGRYADYSLLPKADIILVTHQHGDHLDPETIKKIKKNNTTILLTALCEKQLGEGHVLRNGQEYNVDSLNILAVPAYNIVHKRDDGQVFHPKGEGNGYVITWGKTRVYIAGDTENIPEMKQLKNIRIAFLPMNLPYTMIPEMTADAVRMIRPEIFYPYHFGDSDVSRLLEELKNDKYTEIRIRDMK